MAKVIRRKQEIQVFLLLVLLFFSSNNVYAQSNTIIEGIVRDSSTQEVLASAIIQFEGTTTAVFSDENGKFKLNNRIDKSEVIIQLLGYKSKKIVVPIGKMTSVEIQLESLSQDLDDIIIRPQKEKYSKRDNPAVDLIKKVIEHKKENQIGTQDYYQYKEYERLLLALNEFDPEKGQFKRFKFLPNYMDTSSISQKAILPFSVRETLAENFYRKNPKTTKRIVNGYNIAGIDNFIETEGIDAILKETFKDVSIFDNSITLLHNEFISPLNEHRAVDFYRWYIDDTITIDSANYISLSFLPFNSRDIGFTGNLLVTTDGNYAIKRAILRTPRNMNINFVETLRIQHDFKEIAPKQWIPENERIAINLSLIDALKIYVEKNRLYSDFVFNQPMNALYLLDAPEVFLKDYKKKDAVFWEKKRAVYKQKEYRVKQLMTEMQGILLFKVLSKAGKTISSGYIPTAIDPEKNKLDIGTLATFFSVNSLEGGRFRGTLSTTPNFHQQLFFYGYGAYGLRDQRFKYYAEATWALNKIKVHKDEFPKKKLTLAYKYDVKNLGQRYLQAERDNILMSLNASRKAKMTYNKQAEITYQREYYGGFSYKLSGQTFNERAAGTLVFEKLNTEGNSYEIDGIKTTEVSLALRYAYKEKFFQQRRKRYDIPSERFIVNLSHTIGLKNTFGGEYSYNRLSFSLIKDLWLAPYGKLSLSLEADKIWGEAPYPLLITPSANNSFTIQKGSFYMIDPMEFVHDEQALWEIYYYMGGWLLNRIPLLQKWKWREIIGFRGFIGTLSDRNNPIENHNMLLFPEQTYTSNKNPYMECNIGIDNIFKVIRVDYVRRINYLNHPNRNKHGFRISFNLNF